MLRIFAAVLVFVPFISILAPAPFAAASETRIVPPPEPDPADIRAPGARQRLGYGRLTTNDLIGDGDDRWRSGSLTTSRIWGREPWAGAAPGQFGDLLEFRIQGEIISPANLRRVKPTDRPWAGKLSFGAHTHWTRRRTEFSLGGDLVFIGPQTGLGFFQNALHHLIGAPPPSDAVLSAQIGNNIRPSVVGEVARSYGIGNAVRLRPFAEARAGDESLLRLGADLTIGSFGNAELMVRESVSGQRYRVVRDPVPGVSFVLGADIAKVFYSIYLPSSRGLTLSDTRDRVRAGVHWQGQSASVFYGATWLGREFQSQPATQVIGSLRVQFQF